jgi:hypothetical protein
MSEPEPELFVQKNVAYIQVSEELLMDHGVIPDTRVHRPISRRTRLRWWITAKRTSAATLVYRLIAGEDPPSGDD